MYPYQPYFNQQTQYQRTEVVKVNGEGGAKAYFSLAKDFINDIDGKDFKVEKYFTA